MTTQPTASQPEDILNEDEEGEEDDSECCQRCSEMYHPYDVAILKEGPVCKWCCVETDLEKVRGELDLIEGETIDLFLENWRWAKV